MGVLIHTKCDSRIEWDGVDIGGTYSLYCVGLPDINKIKPKLQQFVPFPPEAVDQDM